MSSDIAEVNIDRTAVTPEEAKALASEIIALAGSEENFDARDILRSRPELAQHRSVIVDLAYEEFCRRLDVGQPPAPREFVRRFPEVAESLLELLEVHEYLGDHPDEFVNESSPAWPEPEDEVSGFSIDHEIGRGGFSRVYLAREKDLGEREVVIKICRQANDEAARLGKLDHPHIVPVYSVHPHPHPGFSIICMPYVGSATLGDVLAEGLAARSVRHRPVAHRSRLAQVLAKIRGVLNVRRRPVADRPDPATLLRKFFAAGNVPVRGADVLAAIKRANERHGLPRVGRLADPRQVHWTLRRGSYTEAIVESGAEICEALAYAHAEGICHCDVKPSNVLLTASGRSLLLDFNLSRQRGVVDEAVGGTLPYMAPEQLRLVLATDAKDLSEIGPRTDLFALGVMMFQLLTGRHPFQTEEFTEGGNKEAAERLLEFQGNAQNLSGELERLMSPTAAVVLAQCLAFDPNDRPPSAEQVARRLRDELRTIPWARRWVRAHPVKASVAAALIMATSLSIHLATRPPAHVRHFKSGIARLEDGEFTDASRCFGDARDACGGEDTDFSGLTQVLGGWADYWAQQGPEMSVLLQVLQSADDESFDVPRLKYELGIAQLEAGDFTAASEWFHKVDERSDFFVQASVLTGWAEYWAGHRPDHSRLIRVLQSVHNDSVGIPQLEYELGIAHLAADNISAARDWFDKVDASSDSFVKASVLRGWADYWAAQDETPDESARSRVLHSVRDGSVDVLWYELGLAHLDAGNLIEAIGRFDQACKAADRDFVEARVLLGWACLKAAEREGNTAKRLQHMRAAFAAFGDEDQANAEVKASLAWSYVQQEKYPMGKSRFEEAVDLGFRTPAVLNNYGYCLIETRVWWKAVEPLEQAVGLAPRLQAVHHNLAVAKLYLAYEDVNHGDRSRKNGDEKDAVNQETLAREGIQRAMKHLDDAKECGESSGELELDAACIYAFASMLSSRKSVYADNPQELVEKALSCCEAAIEFGLVPKNLGTVEDFAPELKENPHFKQLKASRSPSKAASPTRRLVDIYPDVYSRLTVPRSSVVPR